MPRVYVPNRSGHDFSAATRFGELVFITEGLIDRFAVNTMYRECIKATKEAEEDDLILVSSLPILTSILTAVLGRKFGKVNFLLLWNDEYMKRSIDLDALL